MAGELERMPLFQGGDLQSFRKWVMENLKYPREALEDEVEDDIVVTFIVEKDGTLSEIVVEQGLNLALDVYKRQELPVSTAFVRTDS